MWGGVRWGVKECDESVGWWGEGLGMMWGGVRWGVKECDERRGWWGEGLG